MGVWWILGEPKSQICSIFLNLPTKEPLKSGYIVADIDRNASCVTILAVSPNLA